MSISQPTLFYGEDQIQLKKEVHNWKKTFFDKFPNSNNLSEFKNPEKELNIILQELKTPPFLSEKRLVIVYNSYNELEEKPYKNFIKQLSNIPDFSVLLLIEESKIPKNAKIIKDITKIGKVKEFSISKSSLAQNFNKIIKKQGKSINPQLLQDLIIKLEQNPAKIENEAIKLALFTDSDQITPKEIDQIVKFSTQISVFELIDNLSSKNLTKALNNLHNLTESGEEPTKIFFMIARQIRILIELISLQNENTSSFDIAKITGLHPFVIKKTLPMLKNFKLENLEKSLNKILTLDLNLKDGTIKYSKNSQTEYLIYLEKIIIDLCK